jgi:flavin reductase (DIM6/NTAB) family NADH-FMN oxidoreductase RutF
MNLRKIRKVGTSGTPRCELDSHADTCVAGANCRLISHEGRKVSVHPYSEEYKPIHDVIIGSVATLWVDPTDGQSYILIIHEALYFGKRLADTLLCPNQLRAHGLKVEDVPKQFNS